MYCKTPVKGPLKNRQNKDFKFLMTNGSLMKVESIAECSPWSILQYFWPALSDNWSWKPIFSVFLIVAILHRFYCILKKTVLYPWARLFIFTALYWFNPGKCCNMTESYWQGCWASTQPNQNIKGLMRSLYITSSKASTCLKQAQFDYPLSACLIQVGLHIASSKAKYTLQAQKQG